MARERKFGKHSYWFYRRFYTKRNARKEQLALKNKRYLCRIIKEGNLYVLYIWKGKTRG